MNSSTRGWLVLGALLAIAAGAYWYLTGSPPEPAQVEVSSPPQAQSADAVRHPVEDIEQGDEAVDAAAQEALQAIASRAVARKTGARGLRAIIENLLLDAMFELPGATEPLKCVVTREAVEGGEEILPLRQPKPLKPPSKAAPKQALPLESDAS